MSLTSDVANGIWDVAKAVCGEEQLLRRRSDSWLDPGGCSVNLPAAEAAPPPQAPTCLPIIYDIHDQINRMQAYCGARMDRADAEALHIAEASHVA